MVRVRVSRAGGLKMAYRALEATEGGRLTDVEKRVYFLSFAQVSSPLLQTWACVSRMRVSFFCRALAWLVERVANGAGGAA